MCYPLVAAGMLEMADHSPSENISAELSIAPLTSSPPATMNMLPLAWWAALALSTDIAGNEPQCI